MMLWQPCIKQAFNITNEDDTLIVQQYDAEWNDFIELDTLSKINNRARLRLLKKVFMIC